MALASIGMMIGGAILNATAFTGGNIIAQKILGHRVDTERIRHDKAMEKYQRDYEEYHEKRQKMLDWENKKKDEKYQASKNISNTNQAFELYEQMSEPKFSDYYKPSDEQKTGEMVYVGAGMLGLGYVVSKIL